MSATLAGLAATLRRSLGRPSLVRRLIVLATAWSLAVLVAAALALSAFFNHAMTARFDDGLAITLDGLLAGASVEGGRLAPPTSDDPRTQRAYSGDYWELATQDGRGLRSEARSRSLWDRALPPPPGGAQTLGRTPGRTVYFDGAGPLGQSLRVAAVQYRLPDWPTPVVFMAAEDRSPVDRDVRTFATTIGAALILLGGGLIAAVFVQVRVGLAPLFALRREVAAVRTGKADRVMGDYPPELEPLASELNALVAHNQEVLERQRTHVGNLAHGLKTPLSVLLTEARLRPGPLAEVVSRQAEAMSQQVDHHLRRARAAARAQGQGERTAVSPTLAELARTLERIYAGKAVAIDWLCPDDLCFKGERQDLLEMVGNVMENACQWCGGRVRASAEPRGHGRFALGVEDDGPGLAADQRGEVLRRGARLDESAPGSGLGLSIADELARAYGGALALSASIMGGLKAEFVLPLAEG